MYTKSQLVYTSGKYAIVTHIINNLNIEVSYIGTNEKEIVFPSLKTVTALNTKAEFFEHLNKLKSWVCIGIKHPRLQHNNGLLFIDFFCDKWSEIVHQVRVKDDLRQYGKACIEAADILEILNNHFKEQL